MDLLQRKKIILKKRGIAFAIDYFLIMIIHKSIMLSFSAFFTNFLFHLPDKIIQQAINNVQDTSLLISFIVFWGYFITSYFLGNGQTQGKVFLSLRIYGVNQYPSLMEATLRTLGYFCCFLTLSVLFVIPYFNKSKKGIPDWMSGTYVEYEDFVPALDNNIIPFVQPELFPDESDLKKSA